MLAPRTVTILTLLNLAILSGSLLAPPRGALAQGGSPGVLRGSALEIVDAQGRVRASIKLHPEHASQADGRRHPETVMLRLVDENGRPEVKIGASRQGGGMSLVGAADETQVLLLTEEGRGSVKVAARGSSRTIAP